MSRGKKLKESLQDRKQRLKGSMSDLFEMPREIVLDLPKFIIIGNSQLIIENHLGVVEYSPERVCINTNIGLVEVKGRKLQIRNIYVEELLIEGEIGAVCYSDSGREDC